MLSIDKHQGFLSTYLMDEELDKLPTTVSSRKTRVSPFELFKHKCPNNRVQMKLIHEQLPLPVPCYDLVPVTELTLGPACAETSGTPGSLDLTGGEYKT